MGLHFREYKTDREAQEKYLDFLRDLLKDKGYLALVYMTGILPIKKYGTHSALNMFDEFSMIEPGPLASYVGFTETEVQKLCGQYDMELEEAKTGTMDILLIKLYQCTVRVRL